jgi:hypothetical protein
VPASRRRRRRGGDLDRDGRALRRVVQATGRVCATSCAARARPPMRSALYRPWCFSFGYELPWSDPRRGRLSNFELLRNWCVEGRWWMPFLLSVWLSRCQALTRRWQVSGKMIKKTTGPLCRAKIASGGGPTARMKTATAALLGSDPASGCKTLASPALLPKRSPRRARAQGLRLRLVSTHLESQQLLPDRARPSPRRK